MVLDNSGHNMKMYYIDANIRNWFVLNLYMYQCILFLYFLMLLAISVCRHVPSPRSVVKIVTSGICWHFRDNTFTDELFDVISLIKYLSKVVDWNSRNM